MKITIIFSRNFFWGGGGRGKWTILGPKMGHPDNSGSAVIFLKILHNEKGQLVDQSNNNSLFRTNEPFWARK